MSDKPSYLGLLNAIAVGESQAHAYLTAWAAVTDSADVKCVLEKVAAREGEHGMTFAKRINELGYSVRENDDVNFKKRLSIAGSERSDLEKMEKLGFGRLDTGDKPDIFDKVFTDHSIDIDTGALLGRYIAEERDSARVLRECYELLCEAEGGMKPSKSRETDRLSTLEAKVDAICNVVEDIRGAVTAKSNGRTPTRAKAKR
jgi:rubrerythrin